MKRIILALLIFCSAIPAFAQPVLGDVFPPVGGPTDFWHTGGLLTSDRQMRLSYNDTLVLLYKTDGSMFYDTTKKQMKIHDGSRWRRMVDSAYLDTVIAGVEAGVADTAQFIASIYRLNREIDSVSNITDSLYTVMRTKQGADSLLLAELISTLQFDVATLDSAVLVAFESISNLSDSLAGYVDTAMLNDSLQVIKARDVPYTGATADVNLGTHNILPNSVRLSTTPTGTLTNVGQIYWDATNVTPSIPLNANVTLQMGQEMYIRARNNTGVQINDGQVVYVNDAQGNNPTIALANSDSVNTSTVVGVATENIADNATGFVTTFGVVNGFNTSGFNDGDALYLNTVSGQLSNTIPAPPHNVVKVAIALNSTVNGRIFVHPSEPLGQDTTFTAPYNSNRVAPTQRSISTYTNKIVRDSASALRTAINTKGSGTVTSVTGGYGLTGGTVTTSGTFAVDSVSLATRARAQKIADSLAALPRVTSIRLVGGSNVTVTPTTAITTSGVYTISVTGGSGSPTTATTNQVLYKSANDTLYGASRVIVDPTDGRIVLVNNLDTASVPAFTGGGTKIVGNNRMGMSAVRLVDTVSIPAALQRAINAQSTSHILPLATLTYTNTFTIGGLMSSFGTSSAEFLDYNSTIQNKGFNKIILTTLAPANSRAGIRVGGAASAPGIVCGNTKFSGGGGRGTFTFCLPRYDAVQAIYMGYSNVTSEPATEPSTFLNGNRCLGVGKDAADATLFFFHTSNVAGAPTKVNTGITPNIEDVYRLTVYIAPNSTYYMQLEVLSKTGTQTVVINPTTNIPPVGSKLVMMHYVNKLAAAGTVQLGIIQSTEEIY